MCLFLLLPFCCRLYVIKAFVIVIVIVIVLHSADSRRREANSDVRKNVCRANCSHLNSSTLSNGIVWRGKIVPSRTRVVYFYWNYLICQCLFPGWPALLSMWVSRRINNIGKPGSYVNTAAREVQWGVFNSGEGWWTRRYWFHGNIK